MATEPSQPPAGIQALIEAHVNGLVLPFPASAAVIAVPLGRHVTDVLEVIAVGKDPRRDAGVADGIEYRDGDWPHPVDGSSPAH